MFHRDVMVLGLSDGVMCGATGFGLVLQKLVRSGVIDWNKEGWIIQSVRSHDPSTIKLLGTDTVSRSGKHSISFLFLAGPCSENGHGRTQCSSCFTAL